MSVQAHASVGEDALNAINGILKATMGPFGLKRVSVTPLNDHYGDPSIFVDVEYGLSKDPVPSGATFRALNEIRAALLSLGEDRFPYVRHHFHEKQRVADLQ